MINPFNPHDPFVFFVPLKLILPSIQQFNSFGLVSNLEEGVIVCARLGLVVRRAPPILLMEVR